MIEWCGDWCGIGCVVVVSCMDCTSLVWIVVDVSQLRSFNLSLLSAFIMESRCFCFLLRLFNRSLRFWLSSQLKWLLVMSWNIRRSFFVREVRTFLTVHFWFEFFLSFFFFLFILDGSKTSLAVLVVFDGSKTSLDVSGTVIVLRSEVVWSFSFLSEGGVLFVSG